MTLYYNKDIVNCIGDAIDRYGSDEFDSPERSTIPLLSLLNGILQKIVFKDDLELHLEYAIGPRIGSGGASQTDLMVISDQFSLAIEAKWTERSDYTVDNWLKIGSSANNKNDVLNGWLGLLGGYLNRKFKVEDFSDVVYQMLHRAASACALGREPKMAYLVFELLKDPANPSKKQKNGIIKMENGLKDLHKLLGNPKSFPFYLVEVEMSPTALYNKIASLPKNNAATGIAVVNALKNGPLFDFTKYTVHTI